MINRFVELIISCSYPNIISNLNYHLIITIITYNIFTLFYIFTLLNNYKNTWIDKAPLRPNITSTLSSHVNKFRVYYISYILYYISIIAKRIFISC